MNKLHYLSLIGLVLLGIFACGEEEAVTPAIARKTFTIFSDVEGMSGQLRINKFSGADAEVVITLDSTFAGPFPAFLKTGYFIDDAGSTTLRLNDIVGGSSTTLVNQLDDGTSFIFEDWLDYEGHLSIATSETNSTTLAGGDIGNYELTSNTFQISPIAVTEAGISATATFTRRVDSTVLLDVALNNGSTAAAYNFVLRSESLLEPGTTLLSLDRGIGVTEFPIVQVSSLPGYADLKFNDLSTLDASAVLLENTVVVATTDVGINQLNASSFRSFTLDSVAPGGSTGRLAIRERISEFSVAEIDLPSYQIGNIHPVEVLTGDTSTTATAQVIVSLNNIGPADSISFTHVELDAMGQPLIFDSLASNGHVVIRRSETDNTVIAKGNIESN